MDPWDEQSLESLSLSSEPSFSSSEVLTLDELRQVIRELEEKHLITPAQPDTWEWPLLLSPEPWEEDTLVGWKAQFSSALIAAPPYPWWIGVSAIGETSILLTPRESRTSRIRRGLLSLMHRLRKVSWKSPSISMDELSLLAHYYRTRVW